MKYRPEIDGLRAVAVLPVIAFHAGLETFSGGFVGVDVFFVISGYLITTILLNDLEQGRFTLLDFYDRRARRILPALFTVIAVSIPFAWAWMTPLAFKDFGQSIAAVMAFASNFLFWWETDYFAAEAELKPLLHTWSLAVEEQFYLFFPLLLAFLWKFGIRRVVAGIVILALVSLFFGEWAWRHAPAANFYLPFSRVWELFAGSICAVVLWHQPRHAQPALAAAGLAAIIAAIFIFDGQTPFPSLYALLPVGGTALIIVFSRGTFVAQLLSTRMFVGIGLISYSAYLWHQPLFAFARIRTVHEPSALLMAGLSLLTLVLAWLTWRFIEAPFRGKAGAARFSRRQIFALSGGAMAAFVAFGVVVDRGEGLDWRKAPSGVAYADFDFSQALRRNVGLSSECRSGFTLSAACRTSDTPELLVWGDSYAMHLVPALLGSDPDLAMVQQTKSACSPIRGVSITNAKYPFSWAEGCIAYNDRVLEWLAAQPDISYVMMSSVLSILGLDLVNVSGDIRPDNQIDFIFEEVQQTASEIRAMGKYPVFVSPTPRAGGDVGACLTAMTLFGSPDDICDFAVADLTKGTLRNQAFVRRLSGIMPIIALEDYICPDGLCDMQIDDVFMYRDTGHLSVEGSAFLGKRINFAALVKARADAFYADENGGIQGE